MALLLSLTAPVLPLLAAAPPAESFSPFEYAWLALGTLVTGFVATRIFTPGGAQVDVERYGRGEAVAAVLLGIFFTLMAVAQFTSEPAAIKDEPITVRQIVSLQLSLGFFLLMVLAALRASGRSLRLLFGLDRDRYFVIAFIGVILAFTTWPLVSAGALLTKRFAVDPNELQSVVKLFQTSPWGLKRATIIFSAVVVAPVVEEIFFRGIIYGAAKRYGGLPAAMIFSAALFAFIHGSVPALGGLFVLALGLAIAYEFTGSILAPIVMHATFNASSLALMLYAK